MPEPVTISGAVAAVAAEVAAAIESLMSIINTVSKMPDGEAQMIIRNTQKEE
jgi:hypothetical protein